MNDIDRQALEKLHHDCVAALNRLLKESSEMCKLLSAVKSHSVSAEERRAIVEQRVKENEVQIAYSSIRQELFTIAGWA